MWLTPPLLAHTLPPPICAPGGLPQWVQLALDLVTGRKDDDVLLDGSAQALAFPARLPLSLP